MISFVQAKNGEWTILKDQTALLSGYRPGEDAARSAASVGGDLSGCACVVFGSGAGHFTRALFQAGLPADGMALMEPDEELYRFDRENGLAPFLIETEHGLYQFIERALSHRRKVRIAALESYKRAFTAEWGQFCAMVTRLTAEAAENTKVSAFFARQWYINLLRNLKAGLSDNRRQYLPESRPPVWGNAPAAVVASGPGLNDSLTELRRFSAGGYVIAVLSAARTLLAAGIRPDAVVISDAGPANRMHALGLPEDIPVFASVYASSALIHTLPNTVVFYDAEAEAAQPRWRLDSPSVSVDAALLATRLCRGHYVFFGLDLSYSLTRSSHSRGNAFQELRRGQETRLKTALGRESAFLGRADLKQPAQGIYISKGFSMLRDYVGKNFSTFYYYGNSCPLPGLKKWDTRFLLKPLPKTGPWEFPSLAALGPFCRELFREAGKSGLADQAAGQVLLRESLSGLGQSQARAMITLKWETMLHLSAQ